MSLDSREEQKLTSPLWKGDRPADSIKYPRRLICQECLLSRNQTRNKNIDSSKASF